MEQEGKGAPPERLRWSFGDAVLDGRSLKLFVRGRPVELEMKPLEVLRYLLAHSGEAVSKDDLIKAVWPGRILSDSALTTTIFKLREALGESGEVLKTVHGFGYRLEGEVRTAAVDGGGDKEAEPQRSLDPAAAGASSAGPAATGTAPAASGRRWWLAGWLVVPALIVAWGLLHHGSRAVDDADKSVAVLPLANLSSEKDSGYFADGVQDAIITDLAHVKDLKVISRTSVLEYRDKAHNLRDIGRQLGVANIVEGSVQRAGNRVRVTAQLIAVANDRHLWAETYDRDLSDVFAIQSDVAQRIVSSVSATLTAEDKARIERRPTASAEAYDLYVRALTLADNDFNGENLNRSMRLLERAIELDPGFASAHALLGRDHLLAWFARYDPSTDQLDRGRAEVETALKLQPELAEAHVAMGAYWYYGHLAFDKALPEFDAALRIEPGLADAHFLRGNALRRQGKLEQALDEYDRRAELGPRDLIGAIGDGKMGTLDALRRYPEAIAATEQVLAVNPELAAVRVIRALELTRWHGDFTPLRRELDNIADAPDADNPAHDVLQMRAQLAEYEGRYVDAARYYESIPEASFVAAGAGRIPKGLLAGREYLFAGQPGKARPAFEMARNWLLANPAMNFEWYQHLQLGEIYAYAGDRETAIREARLSEQSNPNPADPVQRGDNQIALARIFLLAGDTGVALDRIEAALQVPSGVNGYDVRWNPAFKALHGNPRFEKLIADNLPQ